MNTGLSIYLAIPLVSLVGGIALMAMLMCMNSKLWKVYIKAVAFAVFAATAVYWLLFWSSGVPWSATTLAFPQG